MALLSAGTDSATKNTIPRHNSKKPEYLAKPSTKFPKIKSKTVCLKIPKAQCSALERLSITTLPDLVQAIATVSP
jgi:hypothetical protein